MPPPTRLAVSELKLSHFRSYQLARIDTESRSVALFGANGVGKTNILEAISLIGGARGLRGASTEELMRRPEQKGWHIYASVQTTEGPAEIESSLDLSRGYKREIRIDGKIARAADTASQLRILWLTPSMDRVWAGGASERRRLLDRITMSFEPGHGIEAQRYEKAMRERNRLLAAGAVDPAWLSALEDLMSEAGVMIAQARVATILRISSSTLDAGDAFPRPEISVSGLIEERLLRATDMKAVLDSTRDEFKELLSENRQRDTAAARATVGPHRSDMLARHEAKDAPAKVCSTGEQKALLIGLLLANCRALSSERGILPVLLLDEVTAHLDREHRHALFQELTDINCQTWMSATSVKQFDGLGKDAAYFSVSETDGESFVESA